MTTQFRKYQGLGNDFVLIESEVEEVSARAADVPALCDRHFGIGADGVLFLLRPRDARARTRMVIINQDGSRPEMCGNGLRCVALHLARQDGVLEADYAVETDNGVLECHVARRGPEGLVEITLGRAARRGKFELEFEGQQLHFDLVSMGNPHAVTFGSGLSAAAIDRLGPLVSGALPGGSNVEFVEAPVSGRFELVVWERGVGRTLACGTGAGATAVALAAAARAPFAAPIRIRLPGGELEVTVSDNLDVRLKGGARLVFEGVLA